jgi:hypothetical protein
VGKGHSTSRDRAHKQEERDVDPLLADIIRLAYRAIRRMEQWMREVVRGFRGFTEEERRAYANELGYCLCRGSTCTCGLTNCPTQHTLAAWNPNEIGLPLFVERAVIGPAGLLANSIDQGMFYRLILRVEHDMLVANVEFKRCANPRCPRPQRLYEEERCPGDGCDSVFTPEETEVVAEPRLFIQSVYVSVRRFRCSGGEHYFRQRLCRDKLVETLPEVRYRVVHDPSGGHDQCPWRGCPNGNPRHPQRGTTLWVREELAGQQAPTPAMTLAQQVCEEALRRWLPTLAAPTLAQVRAAAAAAKISLDDDPVDVVDWLRNDEHTGLTSAQREALRDMIRGVWEELGPEGEGQPT